jgi:hypothetical protein
MSDVFVLCTGPSLTQDLVEQVRGRGVVIAVSNAYTLAPWADAMASTDKAWWDNYNPEFEGAKYCPNPVEGTIQPIGGQTHENSGVLAILVARQYYNPKRILLLGCDFGGGHFFGDHPEPLQNTRPERFEVFQEQYRLELHRCSKLGIQLLNATEGTLLKNIPRIPLQEFLENQEESA